MDADVVIIGAGAAGLAAARYLARASFDVIVLEGRDRVGGRIYPTRPAQAIDWADLGAEFIHGPAAETKALLAEAGTAAVPTGGERWTRDESGPLRRDDQDFTSATDLFDVARTLATDETVDAFLKRFAGADRKKDVELARAFVEGFDAADPAIASVRGIADELHSGVDSESARPDGGYAPMLERLRGDAVASGARLHLRTTVRRVTWRRGAVAVEGPPQKVNARAAIVTVPVSVLRHTDAATAVVFDPELPAAKHDALAAIETGHVVKVVLWFRTRFWELVQDGRFRDASFFRCTGMPFAGFWTHYPLRSAAVIAWVGGPKAVALQGASTGDLVELALGGFGATLEEAERAHEEFIGGMMHDWNADPFARGAYSYLRVGGGEARASLASPCDDTLFFAGEATSSDGQGGTVNGALVTGARAAREAAAALGVVGR